LRECEICCLTGVITESKATVAFNVNILCKTSGLGWNDDKLLACCETSEEFSEIIPEIQSSFENSFSFEWNIANARS